MRAGAASLLAGVKALRPPELDLLSGAPRSAGPLQPVVSLVEIVLTLGIALLVGKVFWALLAPLPIAGSPPAPNVRPAAAPAGSASPFRPLQGAVVEMAAAPAATVETALDLTLRGTWHDGEGRGTAVIEVSGAPQRVFRIGDDICCGAKLEEVYADRVIISRHGARETLLPPNQRQSSEAPRLAETMATDYPSVPVVSIQAIVNAEGAPELRLFPNQNPGTFEALGLRPGDLLISVNGVPAPADVAAAARLFSTLSRDDVVSVSVKREGVEFPVDIAVSDWLGQGNLKN
jgi:general secretion pathway protein C